MPVDDIDVVAKALGDSEAVRPAREALARIEAELSHHEQFEDTVRRSLANLDSSSND